MVLSSVGRPNARSPCEAIHASENCRVISKGKKEHKNFKQTKYGGEPYISIFNVFLSFLCFRFVLMVATYFYLHVPL